MKRIFVGNLNFAATESSIRELFAPYGNVESVNLVTDRDTGLARFCVCRNDKCRRGGPCYCQLERPRSRRPLTQRQRSASQERGGGDRGSFGGGHRRREPRW